MYSYGSSARVGGGSGKRGHGNRPYRAPPDRSKQQPQPPPLKQCDCLVEMDVPEYLVRTTDGEPRQHLTFGGRQAMQAVVRHVRTQFTCHLQVPGKHQGNPVALVAASLEQAIPACHYVLQHVRQQISAVDDNVPSTIAARIHRNVKTNVPILTGRLYAVVNDASNNDNGAPMGCLFRQNDNAASSWSVAYYQMTDPTVQLPRLQTIVDNLTFCDATCQYQIMTSASVVFAMGHTSHVDKLLTALQQNAAALAAPPTREA